MFFIKILVSQLKQRNWTRIKTYEVIIEDARNEPALRRTIFRFQKLADQRYVKRQEQLSRQH